ncbi:MAG TPA: hypothetical protein ENI61_06295 [Ignavibacteria bacterium]|nr:hypothetical protein [Ignavibacteria bacterium]
MKRNKENKGVINNKSVFFISFLLFLLFFNLNFISAGFGYDSVNYGAYIQGKQINLFQTCANCSSINITSIISPDGQILISNVNMNKSGVLFNYSLSGKHTIQIGTYKIMGVGDINGTNTIWNYVFEIRGGNIGFFVIAFLLFFGLTFYGLKIRNEWVGLIGCFGLLILGIFISFNGIDLYKNNLTQGIAYITIAIGLGIGFEAIYKITYF